MFLYTGLAVYNQVKKFTMDECASVLGQTNSVARRKVGVCFKYFQNKILSKKGYITFNGR